MTIRDIRQPGAYRYTYSPFHEPIASAAVGETVCIHTVDAFENIDECRRGLRQRLPVAVAEAMADLGYEDLIEDS